MLSDEARGFIHRYVRSVWALEALLLLRKHNGRVWTIDSLTTELRSSRTAVNEILAAFREAGLISEPSDGTLLYQPVDTRLDQLAADVERAYAERPLAVVKEVMSAPNDKIRNFADAFRLK